MNGLFGLVGNNGDPFSAAGSISYFDSASLVVGDQILAIDSVSGEPTMVLRQHGSGHILFTSDEGIFRTGMTGGGTIATANDRLAANIFAWAADQSTPVPVTSYSMTIDVTVVNDPAVITNGQTFSISESAADTASVGSVLATDVDAGTLQNWTITAGNTDNIFAIDAATGEITVTDNSNLDFDTTASYTLTLTVSDGTSTSAIETVTINVTDVAMAITAGQSFNVSETAIDNTVVGSVSTTGDSPASFSITGGNIGSAFAIDNSGKITIADSSAIDYESLINYTLTIQASDGTTLVSDTVSVTVTDDVEVVAYTIDAIADTSVAENAAFTSVTPALSGATPIGSVTYTLTGTDAALFTVNSSTGVVTMIARDYESPADTNTDNSYEVTLVATDADSNTDSEAFTVTVTDVVEAASLSIGSITDTSVTENSAFTSATPNLSGTPIGTATYSLTGTDAALFTVNSSTGVISMIARDFEVAADAGGDNIYNVTLNVIDDDGNTANKALTVTVTNQVEVVAYTIDPIADTSVAENAAFTSITPNLSGATPVGTVTYTLTGTDAALFTVNSSTGVVTMIAQDYESSADTNTDNIYEVTLVATDADSNTDSEAFTVTVTDVVEAASLSIGSITDTSVTENSAFTSATPNLSGTPIGTATYSLTGTDAALFTVNSSTGVISMIARDFEAAADVGGDNIYNVTLNVMDDDGNAASKALTVTVTDQVEVVAYTIDAIVNTNVAENTAFTSVTPALSGATPVGNVNYTLNGADAALFTVNSNTGVVSMIARDYESAADNNSDNIYEVTLVVTDDDGNTDSEAFTVTVNDQVEVAAYTIDAIANTNVAENTVFTNITPNLSGATPIGTVTYTLTGIDAALFTVDSNTGVVNMIAQNYESAADNNNDNIYEVTLVATDDDGNTASEAFTVSVTDINEFDVITPIDNDGAINLVAENSATNTVVGITALASDADQSTNSITYSLIDNAGGRFQIDNNTGVVSVADGSLLNAETTSSHEITIQATSTDGSVATELFSITVADVNEFRVGSITDSDRTLNTLVESASIGETVGITASARDADLSTNTITYSLTDSAGGLFTIDANTGIVTVASALDYEISQSHNITVFATSNDGSTSSQVFTITVSDINETAIGTITDSNAIVDSVVENANVGDTVGITALAIDVDSNDSVTYSLSDDAGGLFVIDSHTGIVTVNALLDAETATSHTITVLATSTDTSTSSQNYTITVKTIDNTMTDSDDTANNVTENAENGTVVGITALGSDLEQSSDITVSYSLIDNAGGRFTIDSHSGIVTVADSSLLNANIAISHTITIQVSASDGSIEIRNFTIKVISDDKTLENNTTESDKPNLLNTPVFLDNFNTNQDFDEKDTNNRNIDIPSTGNIHTVESETRLNAKKPPLSESSDINSSASNKDELTIEYTEQKSGDSTTTKTKTDFSQWAKSQINDLSMVDSELNDELTLFELNFGNSNRNIWENIDLMRSQMDAEKDLLDKQDVEIEFVAGATISITAGFVSWVLRGGALLSSLLSSVSLFKQFDPLAVVFKETKKIGQAKTTVQKKKQDKVEAMFDKNNTN